MGPKAFPVVGGSGVVCDVASGLRAHAGALGEEIATRIASGLPQLPLDEGLVASCRANVELGLAMLRDGVPGDRAVPPPAARRYAHEVAQLVDDKDVLLTGWVARPSGARGRARCPSGSRSRRTRFRSSMRPRRSCSATTTRCRVDGLASATQKLAHRARVRIGVGEPGRGLEGFRRTHAEAREALRVAGLGGRPAACATRYGRVTVESLASVDDERAWQVVQETLGGLAAGDDSTARLRATLRIFFEEGLNQARTARRLNLHHNTVAYRIRRAEEVLGRPIDDRRLELEVALALAHAFGGRP